MSEIRKKLETALQGFSSASFIAGVLCAVVTAAGKPLVAIVLTFAGSRFALTGVVEYRQLPIARLCDGWLGLAVCAVALYAAAAFALQDVHQRTILPTLSRAGRS